MCIISENAQMKHSLSQNIFSKIFQGGLIIKSPYQLQTNQDVCVEKKILAPWKHFLSNSVEVKTENT